MKTFTEMLKEEGVEIRENDVFIAPLPCDECVARKDREDKTEGLIIGHPWHCQTVTIGNVWGKVIRSFTTALDKFTQQL